jgi:hypothetical protein
MFNTLIEWAEKLMMLGTPPSEWRIRAEAAEALARDFETQNAGLRAIIRKIEDDMKAINDMLQCDLPTSNPFSQNCASLDLTDVKTRSPASWAPASLASAASNETRSAAAAQEDY